MTAAERKDFVAQTKEAIKLLKHRNPDWVSCEQVIEDLETFVSIVEELEAMLPKPEEK